jgi:hypothetical protein
LQDGVDQAKGQFDFGLVVHGFPFGVEVKRPRAGGYFAGKRGA